MDRTKKGVSAKKQVDNTEVTTAASSPIPDRPDRLRSKKRSLEQDTFSNKKMKEESEAHSGDTPHLQSSPSSLAKLCPFTPRQENILLNTMSTFPKHLMDPATCRLYRKLKVRQIKRNHGSPVFSLDKFVQQSLDNTKHYTCSNSEELPYPLMSATPTASDDNNHNNSTINSDTSVIYPLSAISKATAIFKRLDNPDLPVLVSQLATQDKFISSYTSHYLMPHIFKSNDFCPPKIQIFQELMSKRGSVEYQKNLSLSVIP